MFQHYNFFDRSHLLASLAAADEYLADAVDQLYEIDGIETGEEKGAITSAIQTIHATLDQIAQRFVQVS